jgi:hypothetical protein
VSVCECLRECVCVRECSVCVCVYVCVRVCFPVDACTGKCGNIGVRFTKLELLQMTIFKTSFFLLHFYIPYTWQGEQASWGVIVRNFFITLILGAVRGWSRLVSSRLVSLSSGRRITHVVVDLSICVCVCVSRNTWKTFF